MLYYVSRLLGQKERFEHFCLDIFSTGLLLQQMTYNNFFKLYSWVPSIEAVSSTDRFWQKQLHTPLWLIMPLSLPWYRYFSLRLLVAYGTYYLSLNWRKLFPLKSDAPHFHSRIQVSWPQNFKLKKINYEKNYFTSRHGRIFLY